MGGVTTRGTGDAGGRAWACDMFLGREGDFSVKVMGLAGWRGSGKTTLAALTLDKPATIADFIMAHPGLEFSVP